MMKIVVCVRQGPDGEISPFDASAYECALGIPNADVSVISMGPKNTANLLKRLTRLGARRAILLCDDAFAGADTLATAYTLSQAIKKLSPDLILCGRQTLVGDTGQTGPMLAHMTGFSLVMNAIRVTADGAKVCCQTREEGEQTVCLPALVTVERGYILRLPSLWSREGEIEILSAADINADVMKCGLRGSPTRVVSSFENQSGKRKCTFISLDELDAVITSGLKKSKRSLISESKSTERLPSVFSVTDTPQEFAKTVSDEITVLPVADEALIIKRIRKEKPSAVLFGSDPKSKRVAASVAAALGLGLCADCTGLGCENGELMMYRPALSGSIIAKVKSISQPAMATVRTGEKNPADIVLCAGYGVKDCLDRVKHFAKTRGAAFAVSRRLVDAGLASYEYQVGLTGKTLSPAVYIAVGVSGAVQHIVGMRCAGTVIAVNPDKNAPIFDYADYGILQQF